MLVEASRLQPNITYYALQENLCKAVSGRQVTILLHHACVVRLVPKTPVIVIHAIRLGIRIFVYTISNP